MNKQNITKEDILEAISQMPTIELAELVKMINNKFDLPQVSPVAGGVAAATDASQEEQTSFKVTMTDSGSNKITAIKLVRQLLNLGLKDAKEQIDNVASTPVVLGQDIEQSEVDKIKESIKDTDIKLTIS